MKKILILTIALVSLFSCSSDENENIDPIIGVWYVYSYKGQLTNECERKGLTTFTKDGDFSTISYALINNNCIEDSSSTGTWSNKGNNAYVIKRGNDEDEVTITFSDNNNTFSASSVENQVFKRR